MQPARVRRTGSAIRMRIEDLLGRAAAESGERVAVVAGKGRHTYAELELRSDRLALALQSRGVKRGDRIAGFMDGGWPAVVGLFAVLKVGGLFNALDSAMTAESLAVGLTQGRAVGILTDSRLASTVGTALCSAPSVRLVVLAGGNAVPATDTCLSFEEVVGRIAPRPPCNPGGHEYDPAVAFGADTPISHGALLAGAMAAARAGGGAAEVAPWSGAAGLQRMLAAFGAGATVVLAPRAQRIGERAADVAGRDARRYAEGGGKAFDSAGNG